MSVLREWQEWDDQSGVREIPWATRKLRDPSIREDYIKQLKREIRKGDAWARRELESVLRGKYDYVASVDEFAVVVRMPLSKP